MFDYRSKVAQYLQSKRSFEILIL